MEQSAIGEPTYRGTPRILPEFVQYSDDLAEFICLEIGQGKALRSICKQPEMPSAMSVYRWLDTYADFRKQYDHCREMAAEAFANEVIELADAEAPIDDKGRIDSGFVQRQRLRVDTRKWVASKLLPKVYGDKLDVAHSGNVTITRTDFIERPVIEGQLASVAPHQLLSDKSNGS